MGSLEEELAAVAERNVRTRMVKQLSLQEIQVRQARVGELLRLLSVEIANKQRDAEELEQAAQALQRIIDDAESNPFITVEDIQKAQQALRNHSARMQQELESITIDEINRRTARGETVEIVSSRATTPDRWIVCDFCGSPETVATMFASVFTAHFPAAPEVDDHVFDEEWAACPDCFAFITQDRWEELTERSIQLWMVKHGRRAQKGGEAVVKHLHAKFREHYQRRYSRL